MEQKQTKALKRQLWSVYVFVERQVQVGRSVARRSRLTGTIKAVRKYIPPKYETAVIKFLYLNVTKMYKKNNIFYVQEGVGKKKVLHKHDVKSVISIQIREHDRSGRIQ